MPLSPLQTVSLVSWYIFFLTLPSTPANVQAKAPIIALYADLTTSVPIFIAGAIFLLSGFIALLLPFESRGRASM